MMIVFTRGMSRPDSMIAVATSTSYSWFRNSVMMVSSFSSCICPWAQATRTLGRSWRMSWAVPSMVCTRLCTKNTCPPRCSSRRIASTRTFLSKAHSSVWMGRRSRGGVLNSDMSRAPISAR